MDNVLDYMDESFFLDFKAHGQGPLIQFTWIYDHDVDIDALRRFHRNLGTGLLGRCIERSPLPFGRSRWTTWSPPADLAIDATARPRSEITAWLNEQASLPIDVQSGPPWRFGVLPLAEGGAAVTLVVPHVVTDLVGMSITVAEAVNGTTRDFGYPRAHSQTKTQRLLTDLRQLGRDLPHMAKALVAAPLAAKEIPLKVRAGRETGLMRRDRGVLAVRSDPDELVVLPSVTVFADVAHWDERAKSLGGTSNSMLIGFAAKLCELLGWVDSEGVANLVMPVSERTPGDTRGNALTGVPLTVDPAAATDLPSIRAKVKAGLSTLDQIRKLYLAPLPLTPLVPQIATRKIQDVVLSSASITCSHAGDLDPATNRPDGTDAEWFYARHARKAELTTRAFLQRAGGMFFPISCGRINGRIYACICYGDADGSTTTEELTAMVRRALAEFGVTATIE